MNEEPRAGRPDDAADHVALLRRVLTRMFDFIPPEHWWSARYEIDAVLKEMWAKYEVDKRAPLFLYNHGPGSLSEEEPKPKKGRPKKK